MRARGASSSSAPGLARRYNRKRRANQVSTSNAFPKLRRGFCYTTNTEGRSSPVNASLARSSLHRLKRRTRGAGTRTTVLLGTDAFMAWKEKRHQPWSVGSHHGSRKRGGDEAEERADLKNWWDQVKRPGEAPVFHRYRTDVGWSMMAARERFWRHVVKCSQLLREILAPPRHRKCLDARLG